MVRDFSKLTKNNLEFAFDNNYIINTAYNFDCPNLIANIMVNEVEIIQNSLAPPKRVKIQKNLAPWYDLELQNLSKSKENTHRMAIINDDEDSWREFRKNRNIYNKMVK